MAAVGATTFAVVIWGSVLLVLSVFAYLVTLVVREARQGPDEPGRRRPG